MNALLGNIIPAITYILAAVVLLGLCILVHELGHLLGGRMVGIKARVFSLGYGKGVLKKTIGDTTYQVTLIPLGGYCQFYGDDPTKERTGASFEFLSAAPWRRIVTVVMGPLFNLFFGIIIFFVMNLVGYDVESNKITIPVALRNQPAYQAGLRSGDRVLSIGDKQVKRFSDIQAKVFFAEGKPQQVRYSHEGTEATVTIKPAYGEEGRYTLGVTPYIHTIVKAVTPGGAAARAGFREGDEILSVDGMALSHEDLIDYIHANPKKQLVFSVYRKGQTPETAQVKAVPDTTDLYTLVPVKRPKNTIPLTKPQIEKIIAAGKLSIDGKAIGSYEQFTSIVGAGGAAAHLYAIDSLETRATATKGEAGFIGTEFEFRADMSRLQYGFTGALSRSLTEPYEFIVMNLRGMGMLIAGKLNLRENLSGPIRIMKLAGDVAHYKGLSAFVIFMAQISIILMVMNLLPIPIVDGSHIVFYLLEIVRGKPLSDKVMERIQTVGLIFIIILFAFIMINDIISLQFVQKLLE